MTTTALFAAIVRRWYVGVAGLVLTLLVILAEMSLPGVYWSQVNVIFIAPSDSTGQPSIVSSSENLIAVAGLVEREVNAGRPTGASTSSQVGLVDTGVTQGSLVLLPNSGGQWNYNFTEPVLSVQAAGPTVSQVVALRERAIVRIRRTLRRMQAADGTKPRQMIRTHVSPPLAPVYYSDGHPARAYGATLLIGIGVSTLASVLLDRWMANRTRRPGLRFRPGRSSPR